VVLLILAGIWAAVLIPPILRVRATSSPADSISDFRRQLRVLQRTAPPGAVGSVPPAAGAVPVAAVEAVALRPARGSRRVAAEASRAARSQRQAGGGRPAAARAQDGVSSPQASAARARAIRRRRDVLFTLLMGMGTTFVLAMVLSAPAVWMLHVVMDGLFLGFLAMLVRVRTIATEKEMKLRILPPPHGRPQPAPVLAFRRSATN
jgi:hypothetical protein